MKKSWLVALAAVAFLAACSDTPKNADGSDASGMGGAAPNSQFSYGDNGANGGAGANGAGMGTDVADRVFFATDSSDLSGEARATLDRQSEWLKAHTNVTATLEGHADERGTREYNLALGERRATAAKNYLTGQGVPDSRLSTVSYGKERPAVEGNDEAAWAQNRRAMVTVQ